MESNNQEEWVKKLEAKLGELREQRIKVDEANEILKKKLETLTAHLDGLDLKYGKKEAEAEKKEKIETQTEVSSDKNEEIESEKSDETVAKK